MAAGLGGKLPVGLRGKAPVEGPAAEKKCEFSPQRLMFSCKKFRV